MTEDERLPIPQRAPVSSLRMGKRASLVLGPLLALVVGVAACRNDAPECYAAEYAACFCAENQRGYQQCLPSEDGYGACVCNGQTPGLDATVATTPVDAQVDAPSDARNDVESGGGMHRDGGGDADPADVGAQE